MTRTTRGRRADPIVTEVLGETERMMTATEVAAIFRVDPKTVTRWANEGRLDYIRTPGGHRRFLASTVRALLPTGTS